MQEIYAEKFRRQAVESRRKATKAAPRDKRAWLKIAEHRLRLVQSRTNIKNGEGSGSRIIIAPVRCPSDQNASTPAT